MCLDMCSEANTQLLRCVKHELTVTPHNCSIDYNRRCLDIFDLAAEKVMLESCVRGLWDERWCMERRRRLESSHLDSTILIGFIVFVEYRVRFPDSMLMSCIELVDEAGLGESVTGKDLVNF